MKKNRRLTLFLLAITLSVFLAGCVKFDVGVTINKDGTADASILYAVSDTLTDFAGIDDIFDIDEMEAEGWTINGYQDGDYNGFLFEQKNIDFSDEENDLTDTLAKFGDDSPITVDGNTVILDMDVFDNKTISQIVGMESVLENAGASMTFTVNLPIKPDEHNATSVSNDGKSLTWDLLSMDSHEHIYLKVTKPSILRYILLGAGVAAVLVIILVVVVISSKKKKKENF